MKKSLIAVAVLMLAGCGQAPVASLVAPSEPDESLTALDKAGYDMRFRKNDENQNGTISREEWMAYRTRPQAEALQTAEKSGDEHRITKAKLLLDKAMKAAEQHFERADSDADGSLTMGEYVALERGIHVEGCDQGYFAKTDTDQDCTVSRPEWVAALTIAANGALKAEQKRGDAARIALAEKQLARDVENAELKFKMIDFDKDDMLSRAEFALAAREFRRIK